MDCKGCEVHERCETSRRDGHERWHIRMPKIMVGGYVSEIYILYSRWPIRTSGEEL